MIHFYPCPAAKKVPQDADMLVLQLAFEERKKSRLRATTSCGKTVGIFTPRGRVLGDGDILLSEDNRWARVQAANEPLSVTQTADGLLLAKAAYHLGNRHVPLQIEHEKLCYQRDHVLDQMLVGLGLVVKHIDAPFFPESGAYDQREHSHH